MSPRRLLPTPLPMTYRVAMRFGLTLWFVGAWAASALAQITLTLDLKDGDKISDIASIRARVESKDGVEKVEFRVDDELKFTGKSTPYIFKWDTLQETVKEGEHALSVTAFDSNGVTKRVTIKLAVDNEIGLGAAALGAKAQEALTQREYDTAFQYGRRSMKAEPGNVAGSRALAGVYAARKEWDRAVATLEKAKQLDETPVAMQELASYRMQRLLLPENEANFFVEINSIFDLRRKADDFTIERVREKNKTGNAAAQQAIGDALLEAGRIRDAMNEYAKVARADNPPTPLVNRYALTLVLNDEPNEAIVPLRALLRAGKADAASRAILGLAQLHQKQFKEALETVQKDAKDQYVPAMVVASYALVTTGKKRDAANYAKDAVGLAPNAPDTHYAYFMAAADPRDAEAQLFKAISLAPSQVGPLHDYTVRVALSRRSDKYELALNLTDFVLKLQPNHINTRITQALIYLQTGKLREAEPVLEALARREKAPDIYLALASYWERKNDTNRAGRLISDARAMDKERFDVLAADKPMEILRLSNRVHYYRNGYFLSLATLFPDRGEATASN